MILGESKDWLRTVKFLIDEDSRMNLRTPILGNKRKHFDNYTTLLSSP